jgi:hypothetical protein
VGRHAIDGKTLPGARRSDGGQMHLLSAPDIRTGIALTHVTVDAKSTEIPAFTPPPDAVAAVFGDLSDILFVADALQARPATPNRSPPGAHICSGRPRAISQPCSPSSKPRRTAAINWGRVSWLAIGSSRTTESSAGSSYQ